MAEPCLVGGLKNMNVNGKDDIPFSSWNIKFMFETTNQVMSDTLC